MLKGGHCQRERKPTLWNCWLFEIFHSNYTLTKARSFIYANKKQDFIEFEVMLKLSFSLHEFQFIGRHGAFARQMIA